MLWQRLCPALTQPLLYKQCVLSRPVLVRSPHIRPVNLSLGCFRTVRGARSHCAPIPLRPRGSVWRPLLCTFGLCSTAFVATSIWEYENCVNEWRLRREKKESKSFWSLCAPDEPEVPEAVCEETEWTKFINDIQERWNALTEGKKVYLAILGINSLVLAAWQLPRLCTFMQRWFTSNMCNGILCSPLILAAFSHSSLVHCGLNMYALHAAADSAVYKMGKEQFVFFYLSAAVVASLCSYYWLLYNLAPACSLGASGAVFAVYGYLCTEMPDLRLQIIFIPGFDFSGDSGIKAIGLLSLAGVIFRWQKIDHMCHLAGIVAGAAYSTWGECLWEYRRNVANSWENFRSSLARSDGGC